MTDEQIITKAWAHAQYRDTKQPTLIGPAIVEFVRSLTAEELRALYERAKHLTNK